MLLSAKQNGLLFTGDHEIPEGMALHITLGALEFWVARDGEAWVVSRQNTLPHEDGPITDELVPMPTDRPEWSRLILATPSRVVSFKPAMPDLPLVVRPTSPVCLLPGQSATFYVGVPIWIAVQAGTPPVTLRELPTAPLSKSWFGSPTEGIPCYAMRTSAVMRAEDLMPRYHRAICALQFRNRSSDPLVFERACLGCEHLRIYRGSSRLWCNPVRFSYRGRQELSRVVYSSGAPGEDEATELLAAARVPEAGGFLRQSFKAMRLG